MELQENVTCVYGMTVYFINNHIPVRYIKKKNEHHTWNALCGPKRKMKDN